MKQKKQKGTKQAEVRKEKRSKRITENICSLKWKGKEKKKKGMKRGKEEKG